MKARSREATPSSPVRSGVCSTRSTQRATGAPAGSSKVVVIVRGTPPAPSARGRLARPRTGTHRRSVRAPRLPARRPAVRCQPTRIPSLGIAEPPSPVSAGISAGSPGLKSATRLPGFFSARFAVRHRFPGIFCRAASFEKLFPGLFLLCGRVCVMFPDLFLAVQPGFRDDCPSFMHAAVGSPEASGVFSSRGCRRIFVSGPLDDGRAPYRELVKSAQVGGPESSGPRVPRRSASRSQQRC